MDFKNKYNQWLSNEYIDYELKAELANIANNPAEIRSRFSNNLEFGTAGMRSLMGVGTNRLNVVTVAGATQALANVINRMGDKTKGVAIAYDTRLNSTKFARVAAEVLALNGIPAYLFDTPRPTPELSFVVRQLEAQAGIMITASHNPPEYNGYKVYWQDGGQVLPDLANLITQEATRIDGLDVVQRLSTNSDLVTIIGEEIDQAYANEVKQCMQLPELVRSGGQCLSVVYTPLHGTGAVFLPELLNKVGFNAVAVKKQMQPDPNFGVVRIPNPEETKAFQLGLCLAEDKQVDLVLATDPDADRVGVMARNRNGEYVKLTGNQIGVLLLDYILTIRKEQGTLPSNGVVIKSIVSTELARAIAARYDVETIDTLTGFKYIGEKITQFEESGKKSFLFGFEESYGYLVGTHARDKDAIVASLLICEMTLYYKLQGLTLCDVFEQIYEQFGYYQEEVISLKFDTDNCKAMQQLMNTIRQQPPRSFGGLKVEQVQDYLHKINTDPNLPPADMICYVLEDSSRVVLRPSGTEPKVKIYTHTKAKTKEQAVLKLQNLKCNALALLQKSTPTTKHQAATTDNSNR